MNSSDKARVEMEALDRAENAEQTGRRQLWERQSGESAKAYAAFSKYRDMSTARTMAKVAEASQCSAQNIHRWARRWFWTQRTYTFDLVEEEKFREQASRDRVAMRRRQIQLGQVLQSVAAYAVRGWQERISQQLPLDIRPDEVLAMLKLGNELEARGHGEEQEGGKFTRINILIGGHKYSNEKVGDNGEAEGEVEWKTIQDVEREDYESLSPDERRTWEGWKNPPPQKLSN